MASTSPSRGREEVRERVRNQQVEGGATAHYGTALTALTLRWLSRTTQNKERKKGTLESFLWPPPPKKRGYSMESVNNVVFCSLFLSTLCCYFQKDKLRQCGACRPHSIYNKFLMVIKVLVRWCFTWLTSEKARVINWSWVDILVTHLVFVPAVISHIFLPLFEPMTVHKVPAEKGSYITSALIKQDGTDQSGLIKGEAAVRKM